MAPERDEEERERPSWREIDQRRDRQGQRQAPAERRLPKKQAEWVRKMALKQAEALFKGRRGRPEYQKALKELEAAHGTKKFLPMARKFLEEYGLPAEWGTLNILLDFPVTRGADPPRTEKNLSLDVIISIFAGKVTCGLTAGNV